MSDDNETTELVVKLQGPYQFTVRTFFAAAVWLALLLGAVKTLEEGALATAVAVLAWIAFGELYRRFRAIGPLVALGGGPILLLAIWCLVLFATQSPWDGNRVLPPVRWFQIYALGWGIVLSVVVAFQQRVGRWLAGRADRRRNRTRTGNTGDPLRPRFPSRLRSAAMWLAIHTVLALVAMAVSCVDNDPANVAGVLIVFVIDVPVVPVYFSMLGDPGEMPNLALASLIFGGALYAAVKEWFPEKRR